MRLIRLYIRYLSVRLFLILILILVPVGCSFLHTPEIELNNVIFRNLYYEEVSSLSYWLYLVNYFSIVFFLSIVLLFLLTSFYILNKKNVRKLHRKYNDLLTAYLFDYLYDDTSSDKVKRQKLITIKKCLKSDVTKRIFLNRLRRVHLQMQGEIRQRNFNLLTALQCTSFIRTYLHSPYLRHKLFALRIIADFHLQGYEGYIYKLTKRKHKILSSEALVALVKLYIYDDHLFLVDFNKKLSVWDVNMIVSKVQQLCDKNINYAKLVNSEIPEISAVGIILARLDKQIDLKPEVKMRIESSNSLVAEQAFLTYISFAREQEDFDYLTYKFEVATEKAQIEIIKTILFLKNKREKIKFLMWVVENKAMRLKVEAMKTLLNIDSNLYTEKFKHTSDISIRNAFLQIDNQNLIYDFN